MKKKLFDIFIKGGILFKSIAYYVSLKLNIHFLAHRLRPIKTKLIGNNSTTFIDTLNNALKYNNDKPILDFFVANLDDISAGTSITFSWGGSGIEKLFLNGEIMPKGEKKIRVTPSKSMKYTLIAENPFGRAILDKSITVGYPPEIEYINTGEELPFYIEGDLVEFTWKSRNEQELWLICKKGANSIEKIDLLNKKRYYKTFLQDTEVFVKAGNKYGITESRKINLRIAPLPKYDVKVPFPDIMLTQIVPEAMPTFDFSIKESELIAPFPKEILNLSQLNV